MNPDAQGRASPVLIRLYELKSSAAFTGSDFLSLYERDQATLGPELAAREEFVLRPGDSKPWDKTLDADVRFIAVIAAFRDIERANWKAVVPVKANVVNAINVTADGTAVSIAATTR